MDRWGRITTCITSLWPGLPRLWLHGSLFGLFEALTFAMLLQIAVVTTVIWPESIGLTSRTVVWFCVLGFWLIFAAPSFWHAVTVLAGSWSGEPVDHREDLFRRAQREYLCGEWFQAERLLNELLGIDAGDSETRLLLATLHRHVGRWQAAKEELDRLDATAGGERWRFEILQERLALVRWKRQQGLPAEEQDGESMAIDAA